MRKLVKYELLYALSVLNNAKYFYLAVAAIIVFMTSYHYCPVKIV